MDIERRRALNRERAKRYRAARALRKENSSSQQSISVADLERRRALARERSRRHRAAVAQSKKALALQQFNKENNDAVAQFGAYRWEVQRNDPLGDESTLEVHNSWKAQRNDSFYEENTDASMLEHVNQPESICAYNNVAIKNEKDEQETGTEFSCEESFFQMKALPTHAVASNASYNNEAFQRQATCVSNNTIGDVTSQIVPITMDANVIHLLFDAINKLTAEQSQLSTAVNRMNDTLMRLSSELLPREREPSEKKCNLLIPFATLEDFVKFDEKLSSDDTYRETLKNSLIQKYDAKKSVTKNLTAILRKYMTREVVLLYTAQKAVDGKNVFKDTTFSACLLDTIDSLAEDKIIASLSDNEYLSILSPVLSNAKNWGISRHERSLKSQPTTP